MSRCLNHGCRNEARSARPHGRFCSDACRAEYHRNGVHPPVDTPRPSESRRTRPATRCELFAQLLRKAGKRGVTTGELLKAGVGSRYSARLHQLRADGWIVESSYVRDGEWRYVLVSEPKVAA